MRPTTSPRAFLRPVHFRPPRLRKGIAARSCGSRGIMPSAARTAYTPCPSESAGFPPPANHPERRKLWRDDPRRVVDHHEILPPTTTSKSRPTHPSSEPVDRPDLVRATSAPCRRRRVATATALKPCPHLSNVAPSQRCTSTPWRRARRRDREAAPCACAAYLRHKRNVVSAVARTY
jgi:hypothetical protein